MNPKMRIILGIVFLLMPAGCFAAGDLPGIHLDRIELPPGFAISLYARIPGARSMTLGAKGTVFVGTRDAGRVYAVTGRDRKVVVIARGLDTPNGVAFRNGALYVAEVSRILRFDDIENRLSAPPGPVVVNDELPEDEHHGWKFIAFGPDDRLYVPVGAPCNVCDRRDERYAAILRMHVE